MTETRIVKIVMVGSLALLAGLVTFDNLIDYETNYAFVRHVLSMDTMPPALRLSCSDRVKPDPNPKERYPIPTSAVNFFVQV